MEAFYFALIGQTMGSVFGTHFRKYCQHYSSGCSYTQHYGYHSIDGFDAIYDEDWYRLPFFISSRETAFETSMLTQFDPELLLGQISYKQKLRYTFTTMDILKLVLKGVFIFILY